MYILNNPIFKNACNTLRVSDFFSKIVPNPPFLIFNVGVYINITGFVNIFHFKNVFDVMTRGEG